MVIKEMNIEERNKKRIRNGRKNIDRRRVKMIDIILVLFLFVSVIHTNGNIL